MYAAGFLSALSIVIHQAFGKLQQKNCFSHQHFPQNFRVPRFYSEDSSRLLAPDELKDKNPTLERKSSDKELGVGHSSRIQSVGDLGFPDLHLSCPFRVVSGVGIFLGFFFFAIL
jgi:hypothetical protein